MHRIRHNATLFVLSAAIAAAPACGQERGRSGAAKAPDSTAVAKQPPQDAAGGGRRGGGTRGGRGDSAGATAQGGATGARGGAAGGRGGPRTASIVLGASDMYKVARGTVEATIAISGDLRAFDVNTVRSRVDGIIEKVYVREGQAVASGMVLAKFESAEQDAALRSAEADVTAMKSDAETSQWNAEQSRQLFKVGAIAERDVRVAEQAADAAKSRLAAAESRRQAAANVVRDTKVTAPFAGSIEKRLVQDGESTPRGTQMFTIVRTTTLELTGSLPARNADDVKVGQSVRFTADGRAFTGKVARVSPTIDPGSRSVAVYIQVPNPRGLLKGNTFATGQVVTTSINDALVVPASAVRDNIDGTRRFVYKIQGGELAQAFVQTGINDDARGMVQILDGLKEQDQVVVGTPGTLGPGMKVTIIGNEGARGGRGRGQKSAP